MPSPDNFAHPVIRKSLEEILILVFVQLFFHLQHQSQIIVAFLIFVDSLFLRSARSCRKYRLSSDEFRVDMLLKESKLIPFNLSFNNQFSSFVIVEL